MDRVLGKIRLSGDFKGVRDADIQFKFRFCDDGIYYYMVEQVGIWRLAHRGRFEIREAPDLRGNGSDRKVVRLEPCVVDIDGKEQYVYGMLSERGLPATQAEDYFLSVYQYDHAVNPNIKMRSYSFSIPSATGFGTEWAIEPMKA